MPTDIKSLSDDELLRLYKQAQAPATDVADLDDDHLKALFVAANTANPEVKEEPGLAQQALQKVGEAGEFIDRYTGAPTRAAIGAAQEGKGFGGAASAFAQQFGEKSELAPTGKELAARAGLSTEESINIPNIPSPLGLAARLVTGGKVSPAGVAGLGIDVAADWSNIVPVGTIAKGMGKVGVKSAEMAGKVAKAGSVAALETGGRVAKAGVEMLKEAPLVGDVVKSTEKAYKNIAENLAKAVHPSIRPQYAKDAEIALKNGVDPTLMSASQKYGPMSTITRLKQTQAQLPGGDALIKQHEEGYKAFVGAVDKKIESFGGIAKDPVAAGETIREAYNSAVDDLFSKNDVRYSTLAERSKTGTLSQNTGYKLAKDVSDLKSATERKLKYAIPGPDKAQVQQDLATIEAIQENLKSRNLGEMIDQMQSIGRVAYQEAPPIGSGVMPPSKDTLKKLYESMKSAAISTAGEIDPKLKSALIKSNEEQTKFFKTVSSISDVISKDKVAPERVFQQIIASGDTNKIKSFREAIKDNPEILGQLKSAYLDSLKTITKEGDTSISALHRALRNDPKVQRTLNALFDPKEIQDLNDIVRVASDYGPATINPSRTGEMLSFANLKQGVINQFANQPVIDFLEKRAIDPNYTTPQTIKSGFVPPVETPTLADTTEIASQPGFLDGLSLKPSKAEIIAKIFRVVGAHHTTQMKDERKPLVISPEMLKEADDLIKKSQMPATEKAKIRTKLNTTNTIDDLSGFTTEKDSQQYYNQKMESGKPKQSPTLNRQNSTNFEQSRREVSF